MRAISSLLVIVLMAVYSNCAELSKDQSLELFQGLFNGAVGSKPASEGFLKVHPSFKADACLQGVTFSEALLTNTASLISETIQNDDLQMTIRAVREVAVIAVELRQILTQCETQKTPALEAFKTWGAIFENRPAFDMKIFKGVKANFKQIQADIKEAWDLVEAGNFAGAGETLAKMESLVVDFQIPARH